MTFTYLKLTFPAEELTKMTAYNSMVLYGISCPNLLLPIIYFAEYLKWHVSSSQF